MLDIKRIKENPDAIKAGLKAKEVDCDAIVDRILELDTEIRGLKTSSEQRTAQKNKLAKENGKLFGQKKGMEKRGEDTAALEAQIEANKAEGVMYFVIVIAALLLSGIVAGIFGIINGIITGTDTIHGSLTIFLILNLFCPTHSNKILLLCFCNIASVVKLLQPPLP